MLDLDWITSTLAIGGSFPPAQIAELAECGITAVVDLRGEDCDDAGLLSAHHIELLHLPTADHGPIAPALLREGVSFVTARTSAWRRVLVHCEFGIGRSALLGLCVLVAQGHTPLDALVLAKDRRSCVSPSPSQYRGWIEWLAEHQRERGAAWTIPTFQEFQAIAYRGL